MTPVNHNEMAAYATVLGLNDISPNGKHMKGACHDTCQSKLNGSLRYSAWAEYI